MRRHILGFVFLAFLFGFATSARAQDCSSPDQPPKTWNQQPPDPLCGTPSKAQTFSVTSTTVDTCTNKNTNVVYAQNVRQITGFGVWQCSPPPLSSKKCNPTITQQVTPATSPTDYNRFYLRDWDADPSLFCGVFATMTTQDFWQCQGIACTSSCNVKCIPGESQKCCTSPVILDLSGKGFDLTSAANGVMFDISGDGVPMQMGWTAQGADNAFLALPGADGLIHNGKELFGNWTPQPASAHPNGFAALAVYDQPANGGNGDGVIDARDAIFSSLRLWIDANHDGICQPGELHTLPSVGVNSISLHYTESGRTDQYGNQFHYKTIVDPNRRDPAIGKVAYDVYFVTLPPAVATARISCPVPNQNKGDMLTRK